MRGEFAAKQALFAARGGARTPLRAIETRGLLRAIFFFSFWSFRERKGRQEEGEEEEAKDKNFGTQERRKTNFFLKRENWKGHGLCKKRRTLFFRAVLFE